MKKFLLLLVSFVVPFYVFATDGMDDKPVQHMQVAEITSMDEAERVFVAKTADLKDNQTLNDQRLQQIHVATYSIEQSVAYFATHLEGQQQALAKELAIVVEDLHIASENLRQEEAKAALEKYLKLSEKLIDGL